MARIDTNVSSLIAQTVLARSQCPLDTSLERLSTGLRINSGADDPAGLIASQSLQSEMAGLTQAVNNSSQAQNVISTADGALSEVSSLLNDIKGLVVSSANSACSISPAEVQANQLRGRLRPDPAPSPASPQPTNFAGLNLIDGSLNYITSGSYTRPPSVRWQHRPRPISTISNTPVNVNVIVGAAKLADLQFRTSSITKSVTLEIAGSVGVQTLSFVSGTTASAIAFAVNGISDSTGVTASSDQRAPMPSPASISSAPIMIQQRFVSIQAQTGCLSQPPTPPASPKNAPSEPMPSRPLNGGLSSPLGTARLCSSTLRRLI